MRRLAMVVGAALAAMGSGSALALTRDCPAYDAATPQIELHQSRATALLTPIANLPLTELTPNASHHVQYCTALQEFDVSITLMLVSGRQCNLFTAQQVRALSDSVRENRGRETEAHCD